MTNALFRSLIAACAALSVLLPVAAAAEPPAAPEALAAVHKAIGAGPSLGSLSLEGTTRRVIGDREMSGGLEIAIELPDRFLRVDEMGGADPGARMRRYTGVNGTEPLDGMSGGGGGMFVRMAGPPGAEQDPERMKAMQLRRAQREYARLLAVLIAGSSQSFPLEYRYIGEAVSDDGKAHVFEVTGPDGFSAQLFTDQATHLPLMLAFKDVAPVMRAMGPGPGGQRPSREEMERRVKEMQAAGPPPLSDIQLFVSDHREVDGVMLPTRVRRAVNGEVNEEWELTGIEVNPRFKAGTFSKK